MSRSAPRTGNKIPKRDVFRLEEGLRVLFIAIVASGIGIAAVIAASWFGEGAEGNVSGLLFVFFVFAWPVGAFWALILGLVLHAGLRRFHVPRIVLLPIFVAAGAAATEWAFNRATGGSGFHAIAAATSTAAWILYCFGPVKLWGFVFDPSSHSDF